MLPSLKSLLAGLLATANFVRGTANPEECKGDCFAHDPSVIQRVSDGRYFRFNTGAKIGILSSDSLSGPWLHQGVVLPSGSSISMLAKDDGWAPDVSLVDDTYILYYAISTSGSHTSAIGYATSSTLEAGSWTDHGALGISSSPTTPYNAIDPNLIKVGLEYYLNFGSFWSNIYQVTLSRSARAVSGNPYQIAYNSTGTHSLEGSFVWEYSGFYYLFFSSGQCCGFDKSKPADGDEYKIFACRSPEVVGPFTDKNGNDCRHGGGTLVLASHDDVYGPGGQGVFSDQKHGTVLYYHYANKTIGLADWQYQFGWNELHWSDGWPVV